MTTLDSVRLADDFVDREKRARQFHVMCNRRGDRAFKEAMMRARRFQLETFVVGVDTRPCTESPVFVRHGDTAMFARFRNEQGGAEARLNTGPAA